MEVIAENIIEHQKGVHLRSLLMLLPKNKTDIILTLYEICDITVTSLMHITQRAMSLSRQISNMSHRVHLTTTRILLLLYFRQISKNSMTALSSTAPTSNQPI